VFDVPDADLCNPASESLRERQCQRDQRQGV